jgi:CBS domain-containing protein
MTINSINQLLDGRALVSVSPSNTVKQACELLRQHNIGALAVLEHSRLTGILSERDVICRCVAAGLPTDQTRVLDIMTPDPVTIHRQASLADAQTKMSDGKFRHLPVVDRAGDVVGMLSMRDIPTEYRLMVERFQQYRDERLSA